MKANGTHAKDIALHFLDKTSQRYTPEIVGKTIKQAKGILESGYTKEEIISAIDYILERKSDVYSIAYISYGINNALEEIEKKRLSDEYEEMKLKMKEQEDGIRGELKVEETKNKKRTSRFGIGERDFDEIF